MENKRYKLILCDPPWQYHVWGRKGHGRSAENHYPTMKHEDICALPVGQFADTDCALFMWATLPTLPQALDVIKAWGFKYITIAFVWVKKNKKVDSFFMGLGHWTRSNAEFVIIAKKGNPKRVSKSVRQIVYTPIEKHSKKPDEVHDRIVELMGDLPRLELFARQPKAGWDVWGNEVKSDIKM